VARRWRDPGRRLVLGIEAWPAVDRGAWARASAAGADLLDDAGPAAAWSEPTRRKRLVSYGRWLGFLARTGRLEPARTPAGRTAREDLAAYLDALAADCAPVTAWGYVADLAVMLEVLDPGAGADHARLRRLAGRLRARMRPSVDRARLVVPAGRLYAEGLAMMAEAVEAEAEAGTEAAPAPAPAGAGPVRRRRGANRRLAREAAYRDGLMVAVLAACPLRRRGFAALEVGRHLARHSDGRYRLRLEPGDTKGGTALDAPLPASLAPWLDRYLAEVRPRLLRGGAAMAARRGRTRRGCGSRATARRWPTPASRAGGAGDGAAARAAAGDAPVPALRRDQPGAGGARARPRGGGAARATGGWPPRSATTTWPRARPRRPATRSGCWRCAAGCGRRRPAARSRRGGAEPAGAGPAVGREIPTVVHRLVPRAVDNQRGGGPDRGAGRW
jgi:hypothetical protein